MIGVAEGMANRFVRSKAWQKIDGAADDVLA